MQKRFQHSVLALLLASYLLVGVLGHLPSLCQFFGFGTGSYTLTQSRPSRPGTSKVYWTQHKHIPATSRIVVPSPATLTPPGFFHQEDSFCFINPDDNKLTPHTLPYSHESRAPPVS
jgi:hypothetical protein